MQSDGPGLSRMLTYGLVLFVFSLIYFLFVVYPLLDNEHLGITNHSDISSQLLPVLILDIPLGAFFFLLMFKEFGVPGDRELLRTSLILFVITAIIGLLFLYINITLMAEDHPAEFISYQGDDFLVYLNPFLKDECRYGILPEELLDGHDECLSLTSIALMVRYLAYLGPHNPVTLFIGGYILRRLLGS